MSRIQSILDLPIFVAWHFLALVVLLALAWSVGRRLTARLSYRSELEAMVVSTALGMGVWSTTLFLLAVVGLFRPAVVLVLLAASQILCRGSWVTAWKTTGLWLQTPRTISWIIAATLIAILLAPVLTLPLYPPTAFDATMFHLPLADAMVYHGKIDFFDELRYPVFPALQETLFAAAMLFQSDLAPGMIHFGSFLLVAVLLYCWGAWLSSRRAGLWAALLWLGVPAALRAASAAYVDCSLALYACTALFALHRYARRGELGWLVVGGALLGFAAGTKYHGLYFLVLLTFGVILHTALKRRWKHLAWYGGALAAAAVPWYAFIYYHTGNPIFPFFPAVFGVSPWAFELRYSGEMPVSRLDSGPTALVEKIGLLFKILYTKGALLLDRSPLRTLLLPIEIFQEDHSFRGERLSPMFLFGLPVILFMMFRHRHFRYLSLIVGLYLIAWASTAKDVRYLLPVVPIFALLGSEGADRLLGGLTPVRWPWIAWTVTAAVTAPLALQVYLVSTTTNWDLRQPPTQAEEREEYLHRKLRSYEAVRTLNERYGRDYSVYALFSENMKHYIDGRHIGDWFGPQRYGFILGRLHNRDALHRRLTAMEVDFFLVPDLTAWRRHLESQFPLPSDEHLEPLFELEYANHYSRVYRIMPADTAAPPAGDSEAGAVETESLDEAASPDETLVVPPPGDASDPGSG